MRVRDALERALELGEIGVAVAAYVGDELLVDEWVGSVEDTLYPIFSVTKTITATALHLQAQRGLVEYEAPVARYWPEFGARGKDAITVRQVLCHQSGMAAMPPEITPELVGDWEWVTSRLTEMEPLHVPGAANAYHAQSFGWIVGEIVRRTDPDHRLSRDYVREEIFARYGIDDLWLTLPPSHDGRVAVLTTEGAAPGNFSDAPLRAASTPAAIAPIPEVYNATAARRSGNPSAGGIATARDVARFFAIVANGGVLDGDRMLEEDRVRSWLEPRSDNGRVDLVGGAPTSVGMGGFWVRDPRGGNDVSPAGGIPNDALFGASEQVLYHVGAGGTIAFADLERRLAVAICHNRMFGAVPVERHPWVALLAAVESVVSTRC